MTQNPPSSSSGLTQVLRGMTGFVARVFVGVMLVMVAGFVALLTAFVGIALAAAALGLRFTGKRRQRAPSPQAETVPLTLEARRTPRGWTVE
jgi:preprotein translocase subunit SecG